MYTPASRQATLEKLVDLIKIQETVTGIILVGSGAMGFVDEYSDIDLSVVVSPAHVTKQTWEDLNLLITKQLPVLKLAPTEYAPNNYLSAILLTDFLQVDVGVISLELLSAKRATWKVIFDRQGLIEEKMQNSWTSRRPFDKNKFIQNNIDEIWYHVQNAVFALKRNRLFRTIKEIDEIRTHALEIVCLHLHKEAKHYREIDDLDPVIKQKLAETYFTSTSLIQVKDSFRRTFKYYFWILEYIHYPLPKYSQYKQILEQIIQDLLA